ncbi:MAG: HAMP domain-containing sensor histidine kinase [Reichenbachiella sp.]|uniref:sensor histidine kinase n=1 Tax=Reichenbachiella sp. TaxID=2184521 RepID=UPI002966673C|nr:HAMP domain-containing sensor histidine kinase [Reichenbachiella sp.]MDW3211093.1 HAMP domain-containing sensor histidine kinase [Reichenbachiella sp.]
MTKDLDTLVELSLADDKFPTAVYHNGRLLQVETKDEWHITGNDLKARFYLVNKCIVLSKVQGALTSATALAVGQTIKEIVEYAELKKIIAISDLSGVLSLGIGTPSELYALVSSDLSKLREHEYIIPSPKMKIIASLHRTILKSFKRTSTMVETFAQAVDMALDYKYGKSSKLDEASAKLDNLHFKRISQLKEAISRISWDQDYQPINFAIPKEDPFFELFEAFSKLQVEIGNLVSEIGGMNKNLENLVADRTKELEIQTSKLSKINLQLDRFIYSASHELRTPIGNMMALVQLLRDDANVESKTNYLNLLDDAIQMQDGTLSQIIRYREDKKTLLKRDEIDLQTFFEEILDELGIKNEVDFSYDIKVVQKNQFFTDKIRLTRIVTELVKNAIQFSNFKKIELEALVYGTQAVLTVRDFGMGIKPEQVPLIFNLFYRASERSSGVGLGLFIVNEMLATLHGTIEVDSEVDWGTTIILKLPCLMAQTFPGDSFGGNWC